MDLSYLLAALLLGLVWGAVARMLWPGDPFNQMSGPASWGVSILLGLLGAALGFWFFTTLLGIGDPEVFDWGGIFGALIGSLIVVGLASRLAPKVLGK